MNAAVAIIVAVLNAVGPGIVQLLQQAFAHPDLNDNGKAAAAALGLELEQDRADLNALEPLPDPKPTAPGNQAG